jgi:hypothetical protein
MAIPWKEIMNIREMLKLDDQIKVPVRKSLNWNELDDQDPVESAYKVELQTYSDMMKREHDKMTAKRELDRMNREAYRLMFEGNAEAREDWEILSQDPDTIFVEDPDVPEDRIYVVGHQGRAMGKSYASRNDDLMDGLRHKAQMMQVPEPNSRANYQGTLQYPDRSVEHRLMHQGPAFGIKPKPKAEVEQVTSKARRVRVA